MSVTESRVAVVTAFNAPPAIVTVPIPALAPGSALVRVDAATLCGTDAHRWQGHRANVQPPFVPGHETCGTIVATNGEIRDILHRPLAVGDRVISSYPSCGHCFYCAVSRQTNLCPSNTKFGASPPGDMLGGLSEYHYFPPGGQFVRIPDTVSPALAASAACALRTIMHGFELLGPLLPYETVVVLGAGPLGLYASAVARDRGAARVLVIGAPQARLSIARDWGADDVLDLDRTTDAAERVRWVRAATEGRGADVVFQCAAAPAMLDALEMVRPGGRLINIGVQAGTPLNINPGLFFRNVRLSSVVMAEARHFYEAIEFLATRRQRFNFEQMLSTRYPLEGAGDALAAMAAFREVKPVIVP